MWCRIEGLVTQPFEVANDFLERCTRCCVRRILDKPVEAIFELQNTHAPLTQVAQRTHEHQLLETLCVYLKKMHPCDTLSAEEVVYCCNVNRVTSARRR